MGLNHASLVLTTDHREFNRVYRNPHNDLVFTEQLQTEVSFISETVTPTRTLIDDVQLTDPSTGISYRDTQT